MQTAVWIFRFLSWPQIKALEMVYAKLPLRLSPRKILSMEIDLSNL